MLGCCHHPNTLIHSALWKLHLRIDSNYTISPTDPRPAQLTLLFQKGYRCQRAHRRIHKHTSTLLSLPVVWLKVLATTWVNMQTCYFTWSSVLSLEMPQQTATLPLSHTSSSSISVILSLLSSKGSSIKQTNLKLDLWKKTPFLAWLCLVSCWILGGL